MRERDVKGTELDIILSSVKRFSLSKEGEASISPEKITSDENILHDRYHKISALMERLSIEDPLEHFPSLDELFSHYEKSHSDFEGGVIYKGGEFLHSLFILFTFEEKKDDIKPELKELEENILSSLSSDGSVNENHPRLLPLLKKRDNIKAERYRYSQSYINSNRQIVQNVNPLYRNERVVIPIFTKDKKGGDYYISGTSTSGNTTYVEPFELVDLNNKVVLAEEAIRSEKIKIIHDLSTALREIVPYLKDMTEYVASFSFHYAFAHWALKNRCAHIERGENVSLIEARHPLLGDKAVPITLTLPETDSILVLSGANCGGKSVTMKTVALLSLLNQICTYVPASSLSRLPYFDNVLTDIGDWQSIENDESTFSSHMSNIAYIAKNATKKSLVLLDELGSGTDPVEGSALSLSLLSFFRTHSALTICTSHYNDVKGYAYTEEGMMNASMEFNIHTDKPTYRVLSGIPGDSHALSTAERAGMPKEIVRDAKNNLGDKSESATGIINSLLSKSRTLDRKMTQLDIKKREIEGEKERLEKERNDLKTALLDAEKSGYREIKDYMTSTRKELENLVKALKTGEVTKEKTGMVKAYIKSVEKEEEKYRLDLEKKEGEIEEKDNTPFLPGDDILCGSGRTRGKVVDVDGRKALVLFENGLKLTVKTKDLMHTTPLVVKSEVASFSSEKKKPVYTLDVRGLTLEETKEKLSDQIEGALMSGLYSFSIIHGYGDGILQKGVHMFLKNNKDVLDYSFALPEDGGMGKTYVTLRS